jgi:putative nucleotidyltransferase with HDIG domain/PAS domain S-box-containing protein
VIGTGVDVTERRNAENGVRWRTEDLTLLSTLNESANRGDDLRSIAELLALGTKGDLSNHGTLLYTLDEAATCLTMQGVHLHKGIAHRIEKLTGGPIPRTFNVRLADCPTFSEVIERRSPLVIEGNEALAETMRQIVLASDLPSAAGTTLLGLIPAVLKLLDLRAVTLMPLVSEGESVGMVSIGGSAPLSPVQTGRLSNIARQVAVIVRHRRSEEALRLSQATLAEAQRVARIGNWSWDIVRDERHWSEEVYRILGLPAADWRPAYRDFLQAVHPEDRDRVKAALEKARRTGRRYSVDHRVVRPDGTVRVVHEQAEFSFDENGKPTRLIGTMQDITKQNQAQKLQAVLLSIAEAVNSTDSLEELLGTIHTELGRLIDTTNFYVALFDETTGTYTFPYHVDEYDDDEPLGPVHLGKSLTDYVRRRGEAVMIDSQLHQELMAEGEVDMVGTPSTAWLGAPLKSGGKDIGVVAVQSYADRSPYSVLDLKLMTFVSDNIAMAVRRKLAEEQVSRRLRMEEAVSDVASGLIRSDVDDTDATVQAALKSAGTLLCARHCFAWLGERSDEGTREAYEWCAERVPPLVYELAPVIRTSLPWLTETMAARGCARVNTPEDVPPEAGALRHLLESTELGTMLLVPMGDGSGSSGLVGVLGSPINMQSSESVTFLNTLAATLAGALERRRADEALRCSYESLRSVMHGTVDALSRLGEARDPYTAGHQQRVAELACAIAREMGFPEDRIEGIRVAGMLHDIGKVHVPGEILSKPGSLNDIEFGFIKTHPTVGYEILRAVEFPWPVAEVACQHHERLDGSGYPNGLSGEEIIPEARIVAVADVVEAMCTHRPYRPALPTDAAIEELARSRGTLYGPTAVDACLKLLRTGRLKLGK